jgi:hypothetical protein
MILSWFLLNESRFSMFSRRILAYESE